MRNSEYNTSNWTGKTPRSLEEAFGPYQSGNSIVKEIKTMSFWGAVAYSVVLASILLAAHIAAAMLTGI